MNLRLVLCFEKLNTFVKFKVLTAANTKMDVFLNTFISQLFYKYNINNMDTLSQHKV